ncbi:unnamed protein product, partial [Scytosiphon promiscuus]
MPERGQRLVERDAQPPLGLSRKNSSRNSGSRCSPSMMAAAAAAAPGRGPLGPTASRKQGRRRNKGSSSHSRFLYALAVVHVCFGTALTAAAPLRDSPVVQFAGMATAEPGPAGRSAGGDLALPRTEGLSVLAARGAATVRSPGGNGGTLSQPTTAAAALFHTPSENAEGSGVGNGVESITAVAADAATGAAATTAGASESAPGSSAAAAMARDGLASPISPPSPSRELQETDRGDSEADQDRRGEDESESEPDFSDAVGLVEETPEEEAGEEDLVVIIAVAIACGVLTLVLLCVVRKVLELCNLRNDPTGTLRYSQEEGLSKRTIERLPHTRYKK